MSKNFEIVKRAIYYHVINLQEFNFTFLGGEFIRFHTKRNEGLKKLNEFLDRLDIRMVSNILDNHTEINVPSWIRRKQFVIDYNSKGNLDLVRLK